MDQLINFTKKVKLAGLKIASKNLGITMSGPKVLFFLDENRTDTTEISGRLPTWGIWHYCHSCDEMRFVHLYDPWSYSSRSSCNNCGDTKTYSPNDLVPTFSFAYWKICSQIAWEKYPEDSRKRKWESCRLRWLGLYADVIPYDRGGDTLEDLESSMLFTILSLIQ